MPRPDSARSPFATTDDQRLASIEAPGFPLDPGRIPDLVRAGAVAVAVARPVLEDDATEAAIGIERQVARRLDRGWSTRAGTGRPVRATRAGHAAPARAVSVGPRLEAAALDQRDHRVPEAAVLGTSGLGRKGDGLVPETLAVFGTSPGSSNRSVGLTVSECYDLGCRALVTHGLEPERERSRGGACRASMRSPGH